jgi:SecD/SecF fusion protein
MRNKTGIITITVILTLLCFYFISFSLVDRNIRNDATEYATNSNGEVDFARKQKYLDSLYNKPVYNFLGIKNFTYKEVRQSGLNLGLDLQGGMHVVLEVSPVEILRGLAGNSSDAAFNKALDLAKERQKNSRENFTDLFYKAYSEVSNGKNLASVFYNYNNRAYIKSVNASDREVKTFIEREVNQAIDRTFQILRTRIDKFGVVSPNIQRIEGTGRIQVELPGADNPDRVRNLLQGVAKLEFLEVWHINDLQPHLVRINDYLVAKNKSDGKGAADTDALADTSAAADNSGDALTQGADSANVKSADTAATAAAKDSAALAKAKQDSLASQYSKLFTLAMGDNYRYNGQLVYNVNDTAQINEIFEDPKVQALLPGNLTFLWEKAGEKSQVVELVAVKKGKFTKAPLTGDVITDARADFAQGGKGGFEVTMAMNVDGAKKWASMTRRAVETMPSPQSPNRIAIVLDNIVYSAPSVRDEIPNGNSSITGNFTEEESKDLAAVLKAGKLPAPARIVEEGIIGPSLGKEAISQGLNSSLAGLALVVIFMLLYYSFGGAVANFSLLFNVLFIVGVLAQFQAALTLPGIAGIVLTIGMAVDANVLIYERVKEELRLGKPVMKAIELGYEKAFSAIFDANITTILTGIILYWLGSGPVQGFATTLIAGIITSFLSAVFISRVVIEWLGKRGKISEKSFDTFLSRNLFKNVNFDYVGKRKAAYFFSVAIIVAGFAIGFATGGYNLGVDFRGGRSYIVKFDQPIVASDIRSAIVDDFDNQGTEVKTYGDNQTVKVTTTYLIGDESKEADDKVQQALTSGLKDFEKSSPQIIGSSKVGATIADDIMASSGVSILLSLAAIFLYVFVRFKRWQFGMGALIALAHDVLVAIALFGVAAALGLNMEVDQIFIAAVLTVIGYSVNDTVVVFDRIRENIEANPSTKLELLVNKAINETMSRTIVTALTVYIVVLVLLIFGGEILRGFSFIMLVGCIFGTYSSIFIATPVILDFRRKQLESDLKKDSASKTESVKA